MVNNVIGLTLDLFCDLCLLKLLKKDFRTFLVNICPFLLFLYPFSIIFHPCPHVYNVPVLVVVALLMLLQLWFYYYGVNTNGIIAINSITMVVYI